MPGRPEAQADLLQSNDNILDLRGLLSEQETLTVIDVAGRSYAIAADLPLRTALVLLQHAQKWEEGEMDAETFGATVEGMHAILRRRNPSVTRDDVLDGFSVTDMIAVIQYVSLQLRAQGKENGPHPVPLATAPETTKPKRSRAKSAAES